MKASRPYLLRAIHEWLVDNEKTPHLLVNAEMPGVEVPQQYVKDGRIVLNIAPEATGDLRLGKKVVTFFAGFGEESLHITAPMEAIEAIYAFENGRGMYFSEEDLGDDDADDGEAEDSSPPSGNSDGLKKNKGGSGHLKVIK